MSGATNWTARTLDRFAFIDWGYDEKLERKLANNDSWVWRGPEGPARGGNAQAAACHQPARVDRGRRMLAQGIPQKEVEAMRLWKGLDAPTVAKIEAEAR